jgi:hypothetical protein
MDATIEFVEGIGETTLLIDGGQAMQGWEARARCRRWSQMSNLTVFCCSRVRAAARRRPGVVSSHARVALLQAADGFVNLGGGPQSAQRDTLAQLFSA